MNISNPTSVQLGYRLVVAQNTLETVRRSLGNVKVDLLTLCRKNRYHSSKSKFGRQMP